MLIRRRERPDSLQRNQRAHVGIELVGHSKQLVGVPEPDVEELLRLVAIDAALCS
jgi:hypothetical protein